MILQTKYILGTNKQYSIREDGVVIRHWYIHPSKTLVVRDRILYGYLDKGTNTLKVCVNKKEKLMKQLMGKHFKIVNIYDIDVPLIHKDNNPANCSLDNLYYRAPSEKTANEQYHKYKHNNVFIEKRKERNDKGREKITKSYISSIMRLKIDELPDELYKLKKITLKLHRHVKSKELH